MRKKSNKILSFYINLYNPARIFNKKIMKIERKNLPNATISLTIEESAENIAKHRKDIIKYLTKNADIKGFRK
jgi:hypothetical protein